MQIAYISSDQPGAGDRVLEAVARRAGAEGIRLAGAVQPVAPEGAGKCEIILNLLPDGPIRNVSLDLGPGATACRLDAGALEEAVLVVVNRLDGAQALIVNKFGKQEAGGRGMVTAIGLAYERGIPVLVSVSPEWRAAFLAFSAGAARLLPADEASVSAWLNAACGAVSA